MIYELRKRHFPEPWGRPSSGSPEGVEAATADQMANFFHTHYRPNGAILAVAGALEWPVLRDAVARLFGDWAKQPDPSMTVHPRGPKRDHILKDTQQIQIALAYPSAVVSDPAYYRARAATAILGGYSSARLFTEVREKRGLCYSVYAGYESLKDRAAVLCYAGTAAERAQETLDVTLAEVRRLCESGIDAEELDTMRGPEVLVGDAAGIQHEPVGLPRLRLVLPGSRAADRGDHLGPGCPDASGGERLCRLSVVR